MRKILIANRGEIAVRIASACSDAGLISVGVYSDSDADAAHVMAMDEAYGLSGRTPAESYLDVDKILHAAKRSGADAVHPGYGFLSENADFAQAVVDAGLTWIGPSPDAIRALGNKVTARQIAILAGAPLVAGSPGPVASAAEARTFAEEHGLPIAIKAAFGGGGRGLKVVRDLDAVEEAFDSAVREAVTAFGRGECFVEQYLDRPRHVEAQILADTFGNVIVVGTRDCSLQRRHQKLVEEAPAPFLTDEQRHTIHTAAKAICAEANYTGAGTVEFLVAQSGAIAFLEVNTRLQVEHPITEETSGVDLVQEQFRIAQGLALSLDEDPAPRGHSFEFRINAEDVGRGYLPTPGTVQSIAVPTGPGIRLDSGITAGSEVSGEFDSLMAKLIITGADRDQAIRRARRALKDFTITGLPTLLPFHRAVVEAPDFTEEFSIHTRWIENEFVHGITADPSFDPQHPDPQPTVTIPLDIDGKRVMVGFPGNLARLLGATSLGHQSAGNTGAESGSADPELVRSPMSGKVVKWLVDVDAVVQEGTPLVILEAMKMESVVPAPHTGRLAEVLAAAGSTVKAGANLGRVMGE
ncbi:MULTISPECIES: biotin carboxylase N-terminal domain-containing protein [unclassified Arthrobacter]|uniref:acetyl/propionyl/methylcrotonyl-CoA carboxylase subunit alpha n=1 Tax=unclassified Arthrobacter TaxID=235627 RepID=UPI0028833E4C|nr:MULTISPECIES: biotin carboxylase N-terminal domain-containing protein [unclassified Arthrobacter]